MKKCRVKFIVKGYKGVDELFISGSILELGNWDLKDALALKYDNYKDEYVLCKNISPDTEVEYKFLSSDSWNNVECDSNNCDVQNRKFIVKKGHIEEINELYFKK